MAINEQQSTETESEKEALTDQAGGEPDPAEADAAEGKPDDSDRTLEEQLEEAKQEAVQSHDRFLRVAAEFENFKKRTAREMDDLRKYANEALLRDLLAAVDNLERAIDSSNDGEGNGDSAGIIEGVEMTLKDMVKILDKYQVKPVAAIHQPFDPAFHQAFMTEESGEHPENTVLKEFQKGYTLHGRLLRPAMVVVSKSKSEEPSADPEETAGQN
jgi:molecular chaperone GrpE